MCPFGRVSEWYGLQRLPHALKSQYSFHLPSPSRAAGQMLYFRGKRTGRVSRVEYPAEPAVRKM